MNRTHPFFVFAVLCIAISAFAGCAWAQPPEIDAPSATRFKLTFGAEVAALTYANVMDGVSTVHNVSQSCQEVGTPFLIGRRPNAAHYAAVYGSIEAASVFAAYKLERSHSKTLRMIGHGLLITETTTHLAGYIGNGGACAR